MSQGRHRAPKPGKKTSRPGLRRLAATVGVAAAVATVGLATDTLNAPNGDTGWGAPATTVTTYDTGWG